MKILKSMEDDIFSLCVLPNSLHTACFDGDKKRRKLILAFSELIVRCEECSVTVPGVTNDNDMSNTQPAITELCSPTKTDCRRVQLWWCWWGGLPSKTWPTPGWGPPEARLPTPASWTWPLVADSGGTLQSSSRLESSSQSDPSWLPVFTSFWPNFEIYSTGWIHLLSIVTSDVWTCSLSLCLYLWYFVWILSELITKTNPFPLLSNADRHTCRLPSQPV